MPQTKIAILYQAIQPPIIGGLRKDAKPGGYSDGGADIGYILHQHNHNIITPTNLPCNDKALDWVFPDTEKGISRALENGATHLWANTVLFAGHPIEHIPNTIYKIGQSCKATQKFDNKYETNIILHHAGLPVARSFLVGDYPHPNIYPIRQLEHILKQSEFSFPMIVKPVRGRGSQGVQIAYHYQQLLEILSNLKVTQKFGNYFMIEELLSGEEITLTIMPPISLPSHHIHQINHWSLWPVQRFNQQDYIAPYNGDIPVTQNSRALSISHMQSPEIQSIIQSCVKAAAIVESKAPIRIDCRANHQGKFKIFDLNMKPNMTGAGRPGREYQDCLSLIAARADGWQFIDLLEMIIASAWR